MHGMDINECVLVLGENENNEWNVIHSNRTFEVAKVYNKKKEKKERTVGVEWKKRKRWSKKERMKERNFQRKENEIGAKLMRTDTTHAQ